MVINDDVSDWMLVSGVMSRWSSAPYWVKGNNGAWMIEDVWMVLKAKHAPIKYKIGLITSNAEAKH